MIRVEAFSHKVFFVLTLKKGPSPIHTALPACINRPLSFSLFVSLAGGGEAKLGRKARMRTQKHTHTHTNVHKISKFSPARMM